MSSLVVYHTDSRFQKKKMLCEQSMNNTILILAYLGQMCGRIVFRFGI
jgi:hypothetical protein